MTTAMSRKRHYKKAEQCTCCFKGFKMTMQVGIVGLVEDKGTGPRELSLLVLRTLTEDKGFL